MLGMNGLSRRQCSVELEIRGADSEMNDALIQQVTLEVPAAGGRDRLPASTPYSPCSAQTAPVPPS